MRRTFYTSVMCGIAGVVGAATVASGCGSSNSGGPGTEAGAPQDSGMADGPGADGPSEDALGSDAPLADSGDAEAPKDAANTQEAGDGALPLGAGSLLVAGDGLSAFIVTKDGYVAYASDTTGVASAVALAGGAPNQIAAGTAGAVTITGLAPNRYSDFPSHPAGVAVFTNTGVADGGVPNLPFTTWTAASGAQTWWGPGTLSTEIGRRTDGSHVSWVSRDTTGKGTLDVSSSTFQQAYTVATGFTAPPYPALAFGGAGGTDLIVGLATSVLEAFDTTMGTAKTISSNAPEGLGNVVVDPSGMHVAFLDGAGSLWVATAPAYVPVLVSSVANIEPFPLFSADGATLYFSDMSGAVYRSPVPIPGAVTVTTGATQGISQVSPDGNWLLVNSAYASNPFTESDVQLISSQATGGTSTVVDAQPRAFQQWFTADSTHVLEAANPSTVTGESGGIPLVPQTTLLSYDIATKAMAPSITTTMLGTGNSATGTLVVFFDNPRLGSAPGRLLCDLRLVDVGVASPASSLIQADIECGSRFGVGQLPIAPLLSADAKTVVYA